MTFLNYKQQETVRGDLQALIFSNVQFFCSDALSHQALPLNGSGISLALESSTNLYQLQFLPPAKQPWTLELLHLSTAEG